MTIKNGMWFISNNIASKERTYSIFFTMKRLKRFIRSEFVVSSARGTDFMINSVKPASRITFICSIFNKWCKGTACNFLENNIHSNNCLQNKI